MPLQRLPKILQVGRGGDGGGAMRQGTFERDPYLEDLRNQLNIRRTDEGAALRHHHDESLALKLLQGLAHRHQAQSMMLRQLRHLEPEARRQPATDDIGANLVVDPFVEGAGEGRRGCHS